jgi:hypothetical protein
MSKGFFAPLTAWLGKMVGMPIVVKKGLALFFGVVLPVLCVGFDPIVFRSSGHGDGSLLVAFQPFVYAFIPLAIGALCVWLFGRNFSGPVLAALAGVFAGAVLFSLPLGLVLLPFSLFGMFVATIVAALGFSPLLTMVVYYRAMHSAFRNARAKCAVGNVWKWLLAGTAAVVAVPALFQLSLVGAINVLAVSAAKGEAESGVPLWVMTGYTRLCGDGFVLAVYTRESDESRRERLAAVYHAITGRKAEDQVRNDD